MLGVAGTGGVVAAVAEEEEGSAEQMLMLAPVPSSKVFVAPGTAVMIRALSCSMAYIVTLSLLAWLTQLAETAYTIADQEGNSSFLVALG